MNIILSLLSINYLSFDQQGKHEFSFTGSGESIYLKRGKYAIDVYGAQGGRGYANGELGGEGGPGAHVHGEFYITLNESVQYYIFVGEQGVGNIRDPGTIEGPNRGGFNGGGAGGADVYWSDTEGIPNDAPGGGGGATDLRTSFSETQTRLIVAGGGSGGAFNCQGNPGGTLCGMTSAWHCGVYECSNNTNTNYLDGKNCSYPNGQGATGFNYTSTPPSGGGGGYCGGHDSLSDDEVWPPIADSGSSYAKECLNDYDEELCFFNVEMFSGEKEGDGSLIITKIWECEDENCLFCKNASNKCQTCKQGFLRYNGKCVTSCPESSFQNGIDCIDCNPECKTCQNSKDECTSCINSYYLYNSSCYSDCSLFNNEMTNLYYGKDLIEKKCKNCIDENCIDCNENYKICANCSSFYYLNETSNECIHIPSNKFSKSEYFSCSLEFSYSNSFSSTDKFTFSNKFSNSYDFSDSNAFSKTHDFTFSNVFVLTTEFTQSNDFSKSNDFSFSDKFQHTEYFSLSSKFTSSFKFSNSKIFSQSNIFSNSFYFTFSDIFSPSNHLDSNEFTSSMKLTESNKVSKSSHFTSTDRFTKSIQFSCSSHFTESSQFTQSNQFSTPYKRKTTITVSILFSYILLKSVSFSISHFYSYSFSITNMNGQISYVSEMSYYLSYFPYIIRYYTLIDVPTIVVIELPNKKRISSEMLIGICCGCASVFFFTLALIIMIYRKMNNQQILSIEYSISEEEKNDQIINEPKIEITEISDDNLNLDFWI